MDIYYGAAPAKQIAASVSLRALGAFPRFGVSNTVYFRIITTSVLKAGCAAALAFLTNDIAQVGRLKGAIVQGCLGFCLKFPSLQGFVQCA